VNVRRRHAHPVPAPVGHGGTLSRVTALISLDQLEPPGPPDPRSLRPPPRFEHVSLASYQPQHPTQAAARERLREFVQGRAWRGTARAQARAGGVRSWLPWRKPHGPSGAGLFLDGGFGVGKTHLLASAYALADTPHKRYASFQELVYLIGVMGMTRAQEELGRAELLCIDEFELDDPGNTLIVKTFLASVFARGGAVVTTSNTPPEAQGRGRFNAEDFQREIQSLARGFEVVSIDGPDYRHRDHPGAWLPASRVAWLEQHEKTRAPRVRATWQELLFTLAQVHPSRYPGLVAQMGTLYLTGARPIAAQHEALRFVHFIDTLYDRAVALRASGEGALVALFDASYRDGAYAKKHHRCLSRLTELLEDVPTDPDAAAAPSPGTVVRSA
jgi:cell division protein ZapE